MRVYLIVGFPSSCRCRHLVQAAIFAGYYKLSRRGDAPNRSSNNAAVAGQGVDSSTPRPRSPAPRNGASHIHLGILYFFGFAKPAPVIRAQRSASPNTVKAWLVP